MPLPGPPFPLRCLCPVLLAVCACLTALAPAQAQQADYDPSWYQPSRPYVKVAVTEDGVYSFSGEDLALLGVSTSGIAPSTLQLFENGREIPIWYTGQAGGLDNEARIYFVGRRNRGTDESWAYSDRPDWQSSTYFSLFTDTTFYWLTWGGAPGLRYRSATSSTQPMPEVSSYRETFHVEGDLNYYDGDGSDAENPFYTRGEGYFGDLLFHNGSTAPYKRTRVEFLDGIARADGREDTAYVRVQFNSITPSQHRVELQVSTVVNGQQVIHPFDEAAWTGYGLRTLTAAIPEPELPDWIQMDAISYNEFNANPNFIYIDWYDISYVRELAAQNGRLRFAYEHAAPRRMHLKKFGAAPVLIFSPNDQRLYEVTPVNGNVTFADRSTASPVYWAVSADAVLKPAALAADRSSNWASTAHEADYVILTTRALRASAEALAEYRRARSGFAVAVVDVQDLFDQFDYGRPTPLAIRRFVHQTQRWRKKPRYVAFWGDALYPHPRRKRLAWEVPSFGKASSDGWYAMQTGGPQDWTEALATGRIPVRDNEAGLIFLQKLQTYESAPLDDWQKRALMLVGGLNPSEQNLLQSLVVPWARRITAAPAGMDTLNFFSNTQNPFGITGAFQDSMRVALRQGASWLTYFGHSSATVWDIVIDAPKDFNNAARLPLALSLGCRTGAFAAGNGNPNDTQTLAELLVVGSINGSIAHWGSSGLGSVTASSHLGDLTHQVVFAETQRTLGAVFQEVKRRYVASGAFSLKELAQFGLIGDPATSLNIPLQPDFTVAAAQLRIAPQAPVPADSNLTVTVTLKNRGLVPADSVTVQLTQRTPDGSVIPYLRRVAPFRLQTDVVFTVPIKEEMVGQNTFQVQVDPENAFAEVVETNNTAERTHVIFSTELSLIAPLEMSAVTSTLPRLRVTFVPRDRAGTPVLFELDTVPTFDTPALRSFRTVASGTYAVWELTEPLAPGRAYFWRARIETSDGLVNWSTSSFFVEEGFAGNAWLQTGALFDVNENDFRLRWQGDRWAFTTYAVDVQFSASRGGGSTGAQFVVEGTRYERLTLGYGMLILDGHSGRVRASGSMPTYENTFKDPAVARAELDSLVGLLREGDYVYIRTRNLANRGSTEIAPDIKAIFRSLGSTAIDTLTYNHVWLMRTRVGYPEETREWVDPPGGTLPDLVQEEVLHFPYGQGVTTSPPLGPARAWEALDWQATFENAAAEVRLDVLDADGRQVLLAGLDAPGTVDLSGIDAQQHPLLRLRATLSDSTQRSTPQLTRWSVRFSAIPELALDGAAFTVSADTLLEGETLTVSAAVVNLSDVPADTVVLRLQLTDAQNHTRLAAADTLLGLPPAETATVRFTLGTEGLSGRNTLDLEAEQPGLKERLTFNNTAFAEFSVRGDRVPPRLAVTIEGQSFPNDPNPVADLQSPDIPQVPLRPTIEAVLTDDNAFKLLADTSLVTLTLNGRRVAFSRPDVRFEPATASRNEARVVFTPDFTGQDTVYTLRVRGVDVSENEAEGSPYQTHFRVQSTFKIGTVYPYPNPMSSFTRFAFLVQGSDPSVIEDFRIRIYTLSGRVVQEFDLVEDPSRLEGGALRIGWNKLLWDGRDADGDLLAPGVYLYKVFLRAEGQRIAINNESGIEKLVVLR